MEIIVHYRDCPDIIKKINLFIKDKDFKIFNNFRGYCFTTDELTVIQLTKCNDVLRQYAYKLLSTKIEIEAKHAYVFLQSVSLLYANYYIKLYPSLNDEISEKLLSYLGIKISNEIKKEFYSQLLLALRNGYADNNKSEQYLKKKYIELLVKNCVIFRMIIDTMVKFLKNEQDLYVAMCKSADYARKKGFTDDEIMKTIVKEFARDSVFLKFSENEISNIFLRHGYSKHQSQYLKYMLEAWLERGKKIIKNDIFDMLCVGALDKIEENIKLPIVVDQSTYLISFDETMMKFIYRDINNAKLIDKFLLPQFKIIIK